MFNAKNNRPTKMYFLMYLLRQSFDRCSTVVRQNILFLEPLSKDTRTNPEEIDYFVIIKYRRKNKKYTLLCKNKKNSLKLLLKRFLFILFCVFIPKIRVVKQLLILSG